MAIAYASAGTRTAANASSHNVAYPATVNAGDLLVLHVTVNGPSVTDATGWTEVYNETALSNPKGGVWYRVAAGTEGGTTTTITLSGAAATGAQIFRFTGVDGTTPLDGTPTNVTNSTTGTTTVLPSITTSTTNTMLIYCNAANSSSTTMSSTTGTELVDHGDLGGAKAGALYYEPVSASGATGTRTIDLSASRTNWGAMFALREASAGGTPGDVTAVPATATAAAPAPSVAGAAETVAPVASVSVSAPIPGVSAETAGNVSAVTATATAAAPVPSVDAGITGSVAAITATVTAAAPVPGVTGGSSGGAAVTLQGTPSVAQTDVDGTTLDVPYPSGVAAGEVLTAAFSVNDNDPVTNTPSGWTMATSWDAGNNLTGAVYYRVADGSETGNVTFTSASTYAAASGIIIRWSGVDTATPMDVSPVENTHGGTSLTIQQPSITTATPGARVVSAASIAASSREFLAEDGWDIVATTNGTEGRRITIYTRVFASAGATGTVSFDASGATNLEMSVAAMTLRPGAATPANVAAPTATVTTLAPIPVVSAGSVTNTPVATVAVTAPIPAVASGWTVLVPMVVVSASAPAPVVAGGGGVTAVPAVVTSLAPVPVVTGTASVVAPAATATTLAHAPGVASIAGVAAPSATANASAPAPVVAASSTIPAPPGVVTTLSPAPSVGGGVGATSPSGIVTALALPPTVSVVQSGNVTTPAAIVTTQAHVPSVPISVAAPRATVSVVGRVPGITTVTPDNFVRTLPLTVTTGLTLSGSPGKVASLNLTKSLNKSSTSEPEISGVSFTRTITRDLRLLSTAFNVPGSLLLTSTRSLTLAPSTISITQALVRTRSCTLSLSGVMNITSPFFQTLTTNLGMSGTALIPGALAYRRCETHTAFLYDRGGRRQIAALSPLALVRWERRRDDISTAEVIIKSPGPECAGVLELIEGGRMELVIFRGNLRVWEGPITRVSYQGDQVNIFASDVMYYVHRTIMTQEYDNRYPNNGPVIDRVQRVLIAELARWEAQDPPANVINHVRYIRAVPPAVEAGTAAHTVPYEMTVFEHLDTYAARGGLDYTVVGRSILFFDVHHAIGQTAMVTRDDFIGDPIITQYAAELATYVAMTDGKGNFGFAGGDDPYYGRWEMLHQAYDENAGPVESNQPPSVAEMTSQAKRAYEAAKRPPLVVRVPDNTRLNPNGALDISTLVPGVHIPLNASLPGRSVTQMQKLDNMSVEETPENGETIQVTLSPATLEKFVEE